MFLSGVGTGSTSDSFNLTTGPTGSAAMAGILPLSGHVSTPLLVNVASSWNLYPGYAGIAQTFAAPVTFTKVSGSMVLTQTEIFIGATVTVQAQLYKLGVLSTGFAQTPVPGAACVFTSNGFNPFVSIAPIGQTASCSSTVSASVNPGESLFWVVTASATGTSTANITFPISLSMSIAQ